MIKLAVSKQKAKQKSKLVQVLKKICLCGKINLLVFTISHAEINDLSLVSALKYSLPNSILKKKCNINLTLTNYALQAQVSHLILVMY